MPTLADAVRAEDRQVLAQVAAAPIIPLNINLVSRPWGGQRLADAISSFGRAATLEPANARYSYVYGLALNGNGQTDVAVAVLEDALARHPDDRDLLTALVTINRDRGELEAALQYAERLAKAFPRDPAVLQLLQNLQLSP